eukprot:31468-Pelagococcus_subviridis.AAC.14
MTTTTGFARTASTISDAYRVTGRSLAEDAYGSPPSSSRSPSGGGGGIPSTMRNASASSRVLVAT